MRSPCTKEEPVNRDKRSGDPLVEEMREIANRLSRLESLEDELKKAVDSLKEQEEISYSLLDALYANIAVLDRKGTILFTNAAWQRYARENGLGSAPDSVGVNYLDSFPPTASGSREVREIHAGIRDVLMGRREELLWEYPCHSPDKRRWFRMRVNRFAGSGPVRVLVCHEDMTPLKLAQEALKDQASRIREHARQLEETRTALKVLLAQRESDRGEMEERVLSNVRESVFPYLEKLKQALVQPAQREWVQIVDSRLREIVSPFFHNLTSAFPDLTPREIEVAGLVREGRSSKEIADLLNLSLSAVEFHRDHLRKKLKLKNRKASLRSFLLSRE
jgi:DNA-binding CsgD family transcriptional regulator/PAS domain-containing protein